MGTVRSFETKMMRSSVCFIQRVGCDHLMSVQNAQESTEEKLVLVK